MINYLIRMESVESVVWETKVPLRISVSASDAANCALSLPLHLSLPAISFLPIISSQVQKHFVPEDADSKVWFSFQGSPIRYISYQLWGHISWHVIRGSYFRWHLPVGILLDLYRVQTDLWMITVHFSDFPYSEIEPLDSSAVESSFRMAVKEADQIRTRSERTNQFQTADYKRLWASVREASLAEWKEVGE